MSTDFDVNDDGFKDTIMPSKPCWPKGLTPVPEHGYHTFSNFEIPPKVFICRGYPWPVESEKKNV